MKKKLLFQVISCCAMILICTAITFAAEPVSKQENTDRRRFERLLQERNDAYRKYRKTIIRGKDVLKEKGSVPLDIQDDILKYRDQKDRLESRVTSIAFRYGWDVPDYEEIQSGSQELNQNQREILKVFEPAQYLIRAEFGVEAQRFVSSIELPRKQVVQRNKVLAIGG